MPDSEDNRIDASEGYLGQFKLGLDRLKKNDAERSLEYENLKGFRAILEKEKAQNTFTKVETALKNNHKAASDSWATLGSSALEKVTDPDTKKNIDGIIKNLGTGSSKKYEDIYKVYSGKIKKAGDSIGNVRADNVYRELYKLRIEARENIKTQFKAEKEAIIDAMKNGQPLYKAITKDYDNAKQPTDALLKKLEENHNNSLEAFEKESQNAIIAMHKLEQQELARYLFFKLLTKDRDNLAKNISGHNKPPEQGDTAELSQGESTISFDGLKPSDLKAITLYTGATFNIDEKGKISGKLSTKIGAKTQNELDMIALSIKANGHDKINLSVGHSDPQKELSLVRQAYDAAINAGFSDKEIKISGSKNLGELTLAQLKGEKEIHALKDKGGAGPWKAKEEHESKVSKACKNKMKKLRSSDIDWIPQETDEKKNENTKNPGV